MAKGILNVGGGVVSVDASGNFTVETGLIADGASVFNETGVDVDFRIESDDNANMLFVDGGNDRVGIGIATPASALDVRGTVQVGVDGTGHDVIFYGATAGSNMTCNESDDQLELTDSTMIKLGDSSDLVIYHDGSNSYINNSTGILKIATATSGIAVTISHTTSEITLADNVTVAGTLAVTGQINPTTHIDMPDSANIKLGTGDDLQLYHDGTNSYITNAVGALKIATETSGIALTIGHTTSEVTIADNLTVNGKISQRFGSAFKNHTHASWVMGS